MLVLTRNVCQGIHIGDEVRIVVLSVNGNKVKLGIDAPKNVQVHRDEIWSAIQEQQTKGKAA